MFEFDAGKRQAADGLFLERLDAFMDRSLAELKAFAERESMPLEETRMHVAEWHSKYLFQSQMSAPNWSGAVSPAERQAYIRATLCDVSRILENLQSLSGVHSFVLAVDPADPAMDGFLGGSLLGRDFWRNLRGGGDSGARGLKSYCQKHMPASSSQMGESSVSGESSTSHHTPAQALKAELYEKVRTSLRTVSGAKNAEMRWTHPDLLITSYGVKLLGWPPSIPYQNPSTMKVNQKKELLSLLNSGTMRFVRAFDDAPSSESATKPSGDEDRDEDYSWALQFADEEPSRQLLQPAGETVKEQTPRRSRTPDGPEGIQREYEGDDPGPRKRPKTDESAFSRCT